MKARSTGQKTRDALRPQAHVKYLIAKVLGVPFLRTTALRSIWDGPLMFRFGPRSQWTLDSLGSTRLGLVVLVLRDPRARSYTTCTCSLFPTFTKSRLVTSAPAVLEVCCIVHIHTHPSQLDNFILTIIETTHSAGAAQASTAIFFPPRRFPVNRGSYDVLYFYTTQPLPPSTSSIAYVYGDSITIAAPHLLPCAPMAISNESA